MFLCRTQGLEQASPKQDRLCRAESSGQRQQYLLTSTPLGFPGPREVRERLREPQHTRVHTHRDAHVDTYTHVASEHGSGGGLYSDGLALSTA